MNNTVNRASLGAKKNLLNFKWLLLSFVLSIASINAMWAADVCNNTIIYFDNSASNWNYAYHYFTINDNNGWKMSQVTNTKLYVHKRTDNTWSGYSYIRLVATSGDWGEGGDNMKNWENIRDAAAHHTNTYNNYGFGSDNLYWIKPASGDNMAGLSVGHFGTSYTALNKTITVKAKVSENDGGSYSETASPANLTASSNKFTAYNSCASAQSLSNGTITCGYTATTTLTAPSTDPSGYKFVGWYDADGNEKTTGKTLTIYPTANATYYAYYRKLYTISAGTTVVWDEGNTTEYSSRSNWGNVYLRRYIQGNPSTTAHDALTHLGSGSQFYKTYNSASSNIRSFMFRSTNNDNSWSDNQQSTNIFRNVSGVTLFTYCGSVTSDTYWKLNWQVTTDGKRGASGKTIYFDDTYTNWKDTEAANREIYFNYGVDWDGGGYHRKIDFAVEKVPGTANLYKLKASSTDGTNQGATNSSGNLSHDIYYQKWYVSKYYGYTNCHPITDSHVLERTEIYTDEIVSNDFTLIPTTKKTGGSGTDGSPYIWNTTKMTGHTHKVTVGSHTNGTITLHYTDENGTAQNPTVTTDVAHTCIVNATATANNGYDYTSMTKGGAAYTPGTNHTVREGTTFAATFTAHTYNITLYKGDHGVDNSSATVDFDATGLNSITHVEANDGYLLEGYYYGETKVLNADGSFADANVSGYITSGKWSKYDADATLTAKFTPITFTIEFNANGGTGSMDDQEFTYNATENLTANAFTKAGCYFEGWAESDSDEDAVVKRDQADGCTLSTTNGETKTLYAKWKAISSIATDCWDGGGNYTCSDITNLATPEPAATATWSTANWGGGEQPTLAKDVVIPANMAMTVDEDHAQAKSISLGSSSTLSIDPNKGLEVAGTITKANGSAPTASDLVLESSASGNATLIFNNSNTAAATVQMYSKASVAGSTWNWQYMAPAFTDANALYDYYGSYLYKWNNGGWSPVANGATLDAFAGYCITNKTANSTYVTDGTLVPTTSHSVDLNANEDMVIGNSWTAPIYIGGFTELTFTSTPATIYLFNTGSAPNGSTAGTGPGTYETIPLFSAPYVGNALIAPLQAFFVTTVGGSAGTITMNYDELVRTTTNDHNVNAGPMHAPKRVNEEEDPEVMKIWAIGAEYSDRLVILEREDFTTGFDNGWDGEKKSFSDVAPSVYVIAETEKDAVSAVPDYEGTILGFLAGIDTQCTMNFDYNGEENWYLNDLKEEQSTLITNENSYSFSCSSTDAETRFVISKSPIHKVPTGIENVTDGANARKQMINGALYIVRDGRIYNAEGALVK